MQLPSTFMGGIFLKGSITGFLFITSIAAALAADGNVGVQTTGHPDLRITEVLPDQVPSTGVPGGDWWELTSFATSAVDLSGWRFNDNTGDLTGVFVIPNGVTINPGESIIFAEATTPEEFISWWGAANLPAGLKIVNYTGTGLGFGASGDGVRLWNATTTSATDLVAKVDFGQATQGVSFTYNPATSQFGSLSQVGVNGAFQAAATVSLPAQDIGSPGRITGTVTEPQGPQLTATRLENGQVRIQFASVSGRTYTLEQKQDITSAWSSTGITLNATGTTSFFDVEASGTQRYFRVRVQ